MKSTSTSLHVALYSFLTVATIAATITPAAAPPIPRPPVRGLHFDLPSPRIEVPKVGPRLDLSPALKGTPFESSLEKYRDYRVDPEGDINTTTPTLKGTPFEDLWEKYRDYRIDPRGEVNTATPTDPTIGVDRIDTFKGLLEKYPDYGLNREGNLAAPRGKAKREVTPRGDIAHSPQAPIWKTWQDLPARVPDTGIVLAKGGLTGELAPEGYPNIRIKNVESTGPPLSFELLEKTKGVPYSDAVRAFLIGPDSRVISRYVKSPEGRYLLDLQLGKDFPAGQYEIRIVIDGPEATLVRSVSFLSKPVSPGLPQSAPNKVKIYVSRESLEGESKRTTFDTDLAGQKLLDAGRDQLDRAVVHYRDAYESLDHRSSYELRWKTTLNYARALHDAVLWYRYDYAADARMLFQKLLDEYDRSSSKWLFWQTKLRDIGINERDIKAPMNDLKALELQHIYADYSLTREPNNLARLSSSVSKFADQFLSDERELGERIQLDHSKLVSELAELKNSLQKLERPVLVELADGNFLVANVVPKTGYQIGSEVGPLDSTLNRSRQSSSK